MQEAAPPHLDIYWSQSSESERTVIALLALHSHEQGGQLTYWQPTELARWYVHASVALSRLANRGLVIREEDRYALASTTISEWITRELTAAAEGVDDQAELQRGGDPDNDIFAIRGS